MATQFQASNPSPDSHLEVLYRQTYNSIGNIVESATLGIYGLTQNNRGPSTQATKNTRLDSNTPTGILAGSVVAVVDNGSDANVWIGPCVGDSTTTFDKAVGIAVNDAVGNPYSSSSAVGSGKIVYCHGTGTVIRTDRYEAVETNGSTDPGYAVGDKLYASQNGLLTNKNGLANSFAGDATSFATLIGILLNCPNATDRYMQVQLRI